MHSNWSEMAAGGNCTCFRHFVPETEEIFSSASCGVGGHANDSLENYRGLNVIFVPIKYFNQLYVCLNVFEIQNDKMKI